MSVQAFYDALASQYHLIYADWDASIARQGAALASIIREGWPAVSEVYDVAAGIGTQSLGLVARGYRVVSSDLSPRAVARARAEAHQRGLELTVFAADFSALPLASASAEVILCADNSLPHCASQAAVRAALAEWYRCLRMGGGCVVSLRDYASPPPPGTTEVRPYGERVMHGRRYQLQQRWTWDGAGYELALELLPLAGSERATPGFALATRYLAIAADDVARLMTEVGFRAVRRLDGRFFQPVLVGTKPPAT